MDGIYITNHLMSRKQGVETVATAFTDHLAVVLRLAIDIPLTSKGRGHWRVNVSYLNEKAFRDELQTQWERRKQQKIFYPKRVLWWGRYVKRVVCQLFTTEGTNCRQDSQRLEIFYYGVIYTALQDVTITDTTYVSLKKTRVRIVVHHHEPSNKSS